MKQHKYDGGGRRVTLWLPEVALKVYDQLENKSAFLQLALKDAVGIMQWAIMKEREPQTYKDTDVKFEDIIGPYNEAFPVDELTEKRNNARAYARDKAKNTGPDSELW